MSARDETFVNEHKREERYVAPSLLSHAMEIFVCIAKCNKNRSSLATTIFPRSHPSHLPPNEKNFFTMARVTKISSLIHDTKSHPTSVSNNSPVLRIRICIRMDLHDFGLLDPHPESAFQMRIPDADPATQNLVPKF
jgi:hypothetical protein